MIALKQSFEDEPKVYNLSALLRARFMKGRLSHEQARAFATFPNPEAQDMLFKQLGVLATDSDILAAIFRGDTVLPIEGDFLILPSRQ